MLICLIMPWNHTIPQLFKIRLKLSIINNFKLSYNNNMSMLSLIQLHSQPILLNKLHQTRLKLLLTLANSQQRKSRQLKLMNQKLLLLKMLLLKKRSLLLTSSLLRTTLIVLTPSFLNFVQLTLLAIKVSQKKNLSNAKKFFLLIRRLLRIREKREQLKPIKRVLLLQRRLLKIKFLTPWTKKNLWPQLLL